MLCGDSTRVVFPSFQAPDLKGVGFRAFLTGAQWGIREYSPDTTAIMHIYIFFFPTTLNPKPKPYEELVSFPSSFAEIEEAVGLHVQTLNL